MKTREIESLKRFAEAYGQQAAFHLGIGPMAWCEDTNQPIEKAAYYARLAWRTASDIEAVR